MQLPWLLFIALIAYANMIPWVMFSSHYYVTPKNPIALIAKTFVKYITSETYQNIWPSNCLDCPCLYETINNIFFTLWPQKAYCFDCHYFCETCITSHYLFTNYRDCWKLLEEHGKPLKSRHLQLHAFRPAFKCRCSVQV